MAQYDDLNTKRIFVVGILSILVTAVTALAVQVVYYWLVSNHEAILAENSSYRRQNKVLADQAAEINSYGANPDTGAATIPVEKAMELMLADNQGGSGAAPQTVEPEPKKEKDADPEPKADPKPEAEVETPTEVKEEPKKEAAEPKNEEPQPAADEKKEAEVKPESTEAADEKAEATEEKPESTDEKEDAS